jgi:energy-coupling factor transporter ATP-binding protein EcfA2
MQIKSIEITNFRRFDHYRCEFDPRFTLLMGPNGSGKTSLLKALFVGLSAAIQRFGPVSIEEPDVRCVDVLDPGGTKWRTPIFPARIELDLLVEGDGARVAIEREAVNHHYTSSDPRSHGVTAQGFNLMQQKTSRWLDPGADTPVPVWARFGASHGLTGHGRPGAVQQPFERREQVWQRAAAESVDVTQLAQWFQYNELRTLQEGKPPPAYEVARTAVLSAIHAEDIRYVVRDNQLMVRHADHGWRPFDQLSDGQRRIAAIFCELALRCAALNSHLGESCIDQSPGVVTIDEIDLHLHPVWQRAIVEDLCRVFPKIQFIAASHSPFLLQAAYEHGRVLDVSTGQFVEPTDHSIEDIAESVMGVEQPQRSQRFLDLKQKAQAYYELLEKKPPTESERQKLRDELDEALAAFANDPASAAWLEQRRVASGH